MTIEEKRQKIKEHCEKNYEDCKNCSLRALKKPLVLCWSPKLLSNDEIEDFYQLIIDPPFMPLTPTIKDSGDRTEFSTGAVRDMHIGKGRLDLLPCSAILELAKHCENGAIKYGERNVDKGIDQHSFIDSALRHLFKYLRGDKDENHLVAALWNIAWAVNQEVEKPEMQDIPSRLEGDKE